jgi:hypothetical protein
MSQPIDEFGAIFWVQRSNFFREKRGAGRKASVRTAHPTKGSPLKCKTHVRHAPQSSDRALMNYLMTMRLSRAQ